MNRVWCLKSGILVVVRGLSYANVVATVALFVALGGASYAAIELPRNSVGTPQLRDGAVTERKLGFTLATAASRSSAPIKVGAEVPCSNSPTPCPVPAPEPVRLLSTSVTLTHPGRVLVLASAEAYVAQAAVKGSVTLNIGKERGLTAQRDAVLGPYSPVPVSFWTAQEVGAGRHVFTLEARGSGAVYVEDSELLVLALPR